MHVGLYNKYIAHCCQPQCAFTSISGLACANTFHVLFYWIKTQKLSLGIIKLQIKIENQYVTNQLHWGDIPLSFVFTRNVIQKRVGIQLGKDNNTGQ